MIIPDFIEARHIRKAIQSLKDGLPVPPRRKSKKYSLLVGGNKYPPKYVVGLADSRNKQGCGCGSGGVGLQNAVCGNRRIGMSRARPERVFCPKCNSRLRLTAEQRSSGIFSCSVCNEEFLIDS